MYLASVFASRRASDMAHRMALKSTSAARIIRVRIAPAMVLGSGNSDSESAVASAK